METSGCLAIKKLSLEGLFLAENRLRGLGLKAWCLEYRALKSIL